MDERTIGDLADRIDALERRIAELERALERERAYLNSETLRAGGYD